MPNILTSVRVAPAAADAQSILEIPATDKIHLEDRNHGLAWTKSNNGIYNMQNSQLISRKRLNYNHVVPERTK